MLRVNIQQPMALMILPILICAWWVVKEVVAANSRKTIADELVVDVFRSTILLLLSDAVELFLHR